TPETVLATGWVQAHNDADEHGGRTTWSSWQKYTVEMNAYVTDYDEGRGSTVSQSSIRDVTLIPERSYLIAIYVDAEGGGLAAVAPCIQPHPDNPDVVIEFPDTGVAPNPSPLLAGITAEMLEALGIDPQPFIEAGFLGSSSPIADGTAPTTIATPSPGPN